MIKLTQKDPRWAKIPLGFTTTYNPLTIEFYGCTVTCLAMIIGTTPDVVNSRLKAVSGFSGSLVIWAKIPEAFPGVKVRREYAYNNTDVKNNVPNVLVEVPAYPIGGTGKHWVVYVGNQRLNDPWTGLERSTSDFPNPSGYCVLSGKWTGLPSPINYDSLINQIKDIGNGSENSQIRFTKIKDFVNKN